MIALVHWKDLCVSFIFEYPSSSPIQFVNWIINTYLNKDETGSVPGDSMNIKGVLHEESS